MVSLFWGRMASIWYIIAVGVGGGDGTPESPQVGGG